MTRFLAIVGVVGMLGAFVAPPRTLGQPSHPSSSGSSPSEALAELEGRYQATLSRKATLQRIEKAIDRAVDDLFFVVAGVARGKLEDKNPPIEHLSIAIDDASIAVTLGSRRGRITYRSPRDGSFVSARDPDGEKIRVSQRVVDGTLRQTFVSSEGRRINTLRTMSDGSLRMHVSVRSDKLSAPAEYALPFRRVGD